MSQGLYSGVSGIALGSGLYKGVSGLWSGADGLVTPPGGATLSLDFLNTSTLDSRITFTRASTATFVGSNGLIQTAAVNAPRFDYNPATLVSKGLLIEEQRTNLVLRSEEFDTASWTKTALSVSANAGTSPDGTANADKIVGNTSASGHQINQTPVASATLGTTYTASVYVKASGYNFAFVGLNGTAYSSAPYASINLTTGASATANGSPSLVSVTNAGNGWYRISVSGATTVAASTVQIDIRPSADGVWANRNNAQNGTDGVLVYGAQLEAGAFATSYIPTVAATVTRSADVATMTGTNFSSWYNQSEGTIFASVDTVALTGSPVLSFQDGAGAATNRQQMTIYSSFSATVVSNVTQSNIGTNTNTSPKLVYAYKANDFAACANGAAVATDTSGTVPTTLAYATLGKWDFGAASSLNGHLRAITYYPQRLPNDQLRALTA